jgi:hypothetical protein
MEELSVNSSLAKQGLMVALLDDSPIVHDQDVIGGLDR